MASEAVGQPESECVRRREVVKWDKRRMDETHHWILEVALPLRLEEQQLYVSDCAAVVSSPLAVVVVVVVVTSTSCRDTTSTPHWAPRSTNWGLKSSMTTIVLRTLIWPSSRVFSRVSTLLWLSHRMVEMSAGGTIWRSQRSQPLTPTQCSESDLETSAVQWLPDDVNSRGVKLLQ